MFDALGLNWAVMLMNDTPVLKMALWIVRCSRTGWVSRGSLSCMLCRWFLSASFLFFFPKFHVFWQTNLTRMLKGLTRIEKTLLTWWFGLLIFGVHFSESLGGCSVPVWDVTCVTQTQAATLQVNCEQNRDEERNLAWARGTPSILARRSSHSYSDLH